MKTLIFTLMLTLFSSGYYAQQSIQLVKDINPGTGDSFVSRMIEIQGKFFFIADSASIGIELWVSDGTTAGTRLVKDINPTSSSYPNFFNVLNNKLYFIADDGTHGNELWVSDGTAAGTQMVKDVNPNGPFDVSQMCVFNNKIYMSANGYDGNGVELWVSDGTAVGTNLLVDINTNAAGSSYPSGFKEYNGKLYFAADNGVNGVELWVSNGTASGTSQFMDINPSGSSYCRSLTVMNNKLYFAADDGVNGLELWSSNGNIIGTSMVKDIHPGNVTSGITNIVTLENNKLLFNADNGTDGTEPWVSDGTATGTYMLKDIAAGSNGSSPFFTQNFSKEYNGFYYFTVDDGTGRQLWRTDGTVAGTTAFGPFAASGGFARGFVEFNNKLYFAMASTDPLILGVQIYWTDGVSNPQAVTMPGSTIVDPVSSNHLFYFSGNNSLYYAAKYTTTEGNELYRLFDTTLSVNDLHENLSNFLAYPNPIYGNLNVEVGVPTSFAIFNINGKLMMEFDVEGKSQIDVDNLSSGIYFLTNKENGKVLKLVKE